jgi:DNA-directed RNA polymerase
MEEAWDVGSGIGGLPVRDEEEPLPPKPWGVLSDEEFKMYKKTHPDQVKGWKRRANEVYDRRIRTKSKRYQLAQKLWIANKFLGEPEIYYVWTMDWRGRLYPVQAHVHPQADDTGKALIEFAKGKPLGEEGVYWLAVQLANKYGKDKISFDERVNWVYENEKDILLAATDPLGVGRKFWEEADDPWEFLAACLEWRGYRTEGETYVSHLPIAMDGTCNGLQNFSAMLLDEVGGEAVNLVPSEKPQDVYQRVADKVEEKLQIEARKGDEMAKVWLGKVDRGIVKRPVMTMPYGASLFGMKDQILDELKDRNEGGRYLDCEDDFRAAVYLSKLLYDSIGEVVIAARNAMDWLQEVTKVASKAEIPVRWTTPAGYRVHQYYCKQKTHDIRTYWGTARVRVKLSVNTDTPDLNKRKQLAGISPNFVHSMDASHLMMTINRATDEGITDFAMIHDSYGTHAADTGKLGRILREAFVAQYSVDVLQRFACEIREQLPEELKDQIPPLPRKGKLDLEKVVESRYFFA